MDKQLTIQFLDPNYFETAVEMAAENYLLERHSAQGLYERADKRYFSKQLEALFKEGSGRFAFENGELVGFLAFRLFHIGPSGQKGAASPLCGYGIRHNKRGTIIGRMFQDLAADLCENLVQFLSVDVYAHDSEVLWTYLMDSFCMDMTGAVRDVFSPINPAITESLSAREIAKPELIDRRHEIIGLYRGLINHLRVSPVFYHCRNFLPIEKRFDDYLNESLRVFGLFDHSELIGMIASEPTDWAFTEGDTEALSMVDVFIEPAYRGRNAASSLLRFANDELKKAGINRLFVAHGTTNPTACGFWDKHFTNYSFSLTRRINPEMLGKIKPV